MEQQIRKRLIGLVASGTMAVLFLLIYAFTPFRSIAQKTSLAGMPAVTEVPVVVEAVTAKPALSFHEAGMMVYDSLRLDSMGLSRNVFELALKGMEKLKATGRLNSDVLSIADFSQLSASKRFYIIDLANSAVLFHTWVAHGRNSGSQKAYAFSNKSRSNKSSLGFYVTGNPYFGSNGYSLKLLGMERGFNDNALKRGIVLHGANYVDPERINQSGYVGRSQGCPAVPIEESRPIIDAIKGGSCLFIYHPLSLYQKKSALVR